jgi:hypothetical protein
MPTNSIERLNGVPLMLPAATRTFPIGTNTVVVPPAVLLNAADFKAAVATNQAGWIACQQSIKAAEDAPNIAARNALLNLFDDFAAYEQFCQVSNPSPAQVAVEVRKLNGAMLRLRPVLRDIYDPTKQ